jgi:hypothetical protein
MIVSTGDSTVGIKRQLCRSLSAVCLVSLCVCGLPKSCENRLQASDAVGANGRATNTFGPDWIVKQGEIDWSWIVIHHSATSAGSVDAIHQDHRRRKDIYGEPWLGVGYHFVIGNGKGQPDGNVAATFRWEQQLHGAHSGDAVYNARGVGICLIGNFEKTAPTPGQIAALQSLVATISERHRIPRDHIIGHASIKATACPGRNLPLNDIRNAAGSGQHHKELN